MPRIPMPRPTPIAQWRIGQSFPKAVRGDRRSESTSIGIGGIFAAFAAMVRERPDALFLGSDPFFTGRRVQLATLSARHAIPMLSQAREIVEVGGLMSYGANIADAFP